MSRFSYISKIAAGLAAALTALVIVTTASASDGNILALYGGQRNAAAKQASPKTALPHHGLELKVQLTTTIQDGKPAAFYALIKNNGLPVQFTNATVVVLFDGIGQQYNAKVTSATFGLDGQKTANSPADFVDLGKQQIRLGTLGANKIYKIDGQVAVADRDLALDVKGSNPVHITNTTFFCIKVVVKAQYPGKPNADWTEESPMNCRQYSVPSRT